LQLKKRLKKEAIEALPTGDARRGVHDDMTVITIMFMNEEEQLENSLDEETDVESEKDDSVSPVVRSAIFKPKTPPSQRQIKSPLARSPSTPTSTSTTTTTSTYASSSTQKKITPLYT